MARSARKSRITIRVGQEFKSVRKAIGFDQKTFGEILYGAGGASRVQMVSDLETGNRNMSLQELERLAGCVGLCVFVNFVTVSEVTGASKGLERLDAINKSKNNIK